MPVNVEEGFYLLYLDGRLERLNSAEFVPHKKLILTNKNVKAHFYVKTSSDYNQMMRRVATLRQEIKDESASTDRR